MIYQLAADDFMKAADVLAGLAEWNVYLTAVLQQNSPGRVYVDDVAQPRSAFAISLDRAYLGGDPQNATFNKGVRQVLDNSLFAGNRVNPADPTLAICLDGPEWEQALADILSDWRWPPIFGANYYYTFAKPKADWQNSLPSGYTIAQLDANLLDTQGDGLPKNIADSIRIGWQNQENFCKMGLALSPCTKSKLCAGVWPM